MMTLAADFIVAPLGVFDVKELVKKPRSTRGENWFKGARTKRARHRDSHPESRRIDADRGSKRRNGGSHSTTGGVALKPLAPVGAYRGDEVRLAYTSQSEGYQVPVPVVRLVRDVYDDVPYSDAFPRCVGTTCHRRPRLYV